MDNTQRAVIGTTVPIPLGLIRPSRNNPRKYFDPEKMQALAESIKENGQETAAWIFPIFDDEDPDHHYELIAGERRWRACAIAGVSTLHSEIRPPKSREQQYRESVLENFLRENCTHIETARSVENMRKIEFGENSEWNDKVTEKIGRIFGHKSAWVYQYRSLLKLHPDVQAMMEPGPSHSRRMTFQVAVSIANINPEAQLRLAQEIVGQDMKLKQALAHIRLNVTDDIRVRKNGKHGRTRNHYEALRRFLENLGQGAEGLLNMSHATFDEMFRHRSITELQTVIAVLRKRQDQLGILEEVLRRVAKGTTQPAKPVLVPMTSTGR